MNEEAQGRNMEDQGGQAAPAAPEQRHETHRPQSVVCDSPLISPAAASRCPE